MTKDTPNRALATLGASPSIALQLAGDERRLQVLKDVIAPGCTDEELETFALVCQRTRLDPFAKQIYAIKRRSFERDRWVERLTIVTGVDGFRLNAQRSREYAGQVGPQWCGADGVWRDVWLDQQPPAAARVGVLRKGFAEPVWGTAVWTRAAKYVEDKSGTKRLNRFWADGGPEMLAKTAEVNALKRAFPQETSEVEYASEEELEAERRQVVSNAATYDRIQREFEGPSEYVAVNARGQHVVRATGEVLDVDSGALRPHAPESDRSPAPPGVWGTESPVSSDAEIEHAGKVAQLSELLREAKKRGLSGEPPLLGHADQNPLDAALAYWAQRIENYDLDQQAARQSRAAS